MVDELNAESCTAGPRGNLMKLIGDQLKTSTFVAVSSELWELVAMWFCGSWLSQQIQEGLDRFKDNKSIKRGRQGCTLCGVCHIRYTAVGAEVYEGMRLQKSAKLASWKQYNQQKKQVSFSVLGLILTVNPLVPTSTNSTRSLWISQAKPSLSLSAVLTHTVC